MNLVVHHNKEVIVPNLIGSSYCKAANELLMKNLYIKNDKSDLNHNALHGIICKQSPYAGMIVKKGRVINVTISNKFNNNVT
jgi:beta-lactam-binding protein with PASTA domain